MSKISIAALVVLVIGGGMWVGFSQLGKTTSKSSLSNVVLVPTIKAEIPQREVKEVASGDGKMKLIERTQKLSDGRLEQVFKVRDIEKNTEWDLFAHTTDSGSALTIPFNSWSPDNKQLYIQETTQAGDDYYVFKADGSLFKDGAKFLDVRSYWEKSKNSYQIKNVSGWAGNDLLVTYTTKNDGSLGPSFWFVISSRKFLALRQL